MAPAPPVKMLKRMRILTIVLSLIGVSFSGYSVYVSYRKSADSSYQAVCDINENMSCSKVFTSKYGKGFGFLDKYLGEDSPFVVSNGVYGAIFYSLIILLGEFNYLILAKLQRLLVLVVDAISLYLAYILFFVLKDMCVLCVAAYVINILITICCFLRVSYLSSLRVKKAAKSSSKKQEAKPAAKENKGKDKKEKANQNKAEQNNVKASKADNKNANNKADNKGANKADKDKNANNKTNQNSNKANQNSNKASKNATNHVTQRNAANANKNAVNAKSNKNQKSNKKNN